MAPFRARVRFKGFGGLGLESKRYEEAGFRGLWEPFQLELFPVVPKRRVRTGLGFARASWKRSVGKA